MKGRIRQVRTQLKLTQAGFAALVGVTRDVVASWENGRVDPPEAVVRLICRDYGISYEWLKTGQEPMKVPVDMLTLEKVEQLINGDNDFIRVFFRELADLPKEGWEQINQFVDKLYLANHKES